MKEERNGREPVTAYKGIFDSLKDADTRRAAQQDQAESSMGVGTGKCSETDHGLHGRLSEHNAPSSSKAVDFGSFAADGKVVSGDTKWSEARELMGPCGRPMVHNPKNDCNQFGSTLFYAYDGILFEIMDNDHIASVTLFADW